MANALQILNDDEKKYFESRGDHEPAGYESSAEEPRKDSEVEEDSREQYTREESSEGFDGSLSEGNGAETSQRLYEDSDDEGDDRQESRGKSQKRDFSKAYGIAESKRQELAQQLEQQAQHNKMLQQQLQMLMQQQQRAPVQATPKEEVFIPDPTEDPIGYQAYRIESLNKAVMAQQSYLEKQQREYQEQRAVMQLDNAYKAAARQFMQEAPDFTDAYKFLEQSRIQEYMAMGYTHQQAADYLQEDERALAAKSFKENANPAQRIYAAAKARGYASAATETKLDKVAQGMQKGKSLPRSGGKNLEKGYDISRIDQMSDDEFDNFFNQVKNEAKRSGDYKKDFY